MIKEGVPLGRIGKKSDIAGTCLFLASEAGDYVNGGMSHSSFPSQVHAYSSNPCSRRRLCPQYWVKTVVQYLDNICR